MPKDFTKKSFTRTLRGYSPEDVDRYIEAINGEYGKLEKHSAENERRLVFALRKLESLTKELQAIYASAEEAETDAASETATKENSADEPILAERRAELRSVEDELAKAKAELDSVKAEAEKLRAASEERARTLLSAARSRGDTIILEAQAKSDAIIAASAKKARAAAEQIITDAALASRKIIRDAEAKADDACRDLTTIYSAAERMYREVSEFRSDVFSLYSTHISSIESISGTANGMLDSVNRIVEELESGGDPEEDGSLLHDGKKDGMLIEDEVGETEQGLVFESDVPSDEDIDASEDDAVSEPEEDVEEETVFVPDEEDDPDEDDDEDAPMQDLYITVGDEEGEYYDSFDEIPDDDDDDEPRVASSEKENEDEGLPWDESEDDDEPDERDAEYDEQEDTDEEYDERDAEYDAEEDDFELSDDISGGTNVLDIVKKLGGGKKAAPDGEDFFGVFGESGTSEEEFRRAFAGDGDSDIDEIMRQPLAQPEEPTKPKKHSKF